MQAHFLARQRELTPEHLPWVIAFGILAFVIVWLNDRTKSKASQAKDAANPKAINSLSCSLRAGWEDSMRLPCTCWGIRV